MSAESVLDFWFSEVASDHWWKPPLAVDQAIKDRFSELHSQARRKGLTSWRQSLLGRLAEIIVLDQFSRNLHRRTSLAYACDALALELAQEAIANDEHLSLSIPQRTFLYMPFMHSELIMAHDKSIQLHNEEGLEVRLHWAIRHRDVIRRFGRFPHRNEALGRLSSSEELAFLLTPNSSV